ncbi:lipid biosynthesis B12-binding/radical SAM protein [uncultured Desulfobacter sp.]|uniref:lipid biosynthesis B12-binding/radical SAM protein n=1 Tax=uncultured Desulfobacter sp. TaxID=240139 RepID=UPI002AABA470|nr:lipid biosynthesis B12-binding/radical SAM protein [uncultured Desulfobacter sp.]
MAKIFLISANTTQEPLPVYPIGMALVDAALKAKGHETEQFDLLYDMEKGHVGLEQALRAFGPDIIGISIRNIDNVDSLSPDSWYLSGVKALIANIRQVQHAPIVIGGPAVSIMPETILTYCGADYCVAGEGEVAFNLLIDKILGNENPPRVMGPLTPRMTPEQFYSPSYQPRFTDYYFDASGMLNYQTKRGCPFGCNYCSYPLIEGKTIRHQEPEFVVENLKRLKSEFNVTSLFFSDSVFNDPQGRYLEVAEALARADLGVKWAAYFRPAHLSQKELALLKKAGLYAMEIGSDGACDTTLEGIGKTFDFSSILAINEACIQAEIPCAHFFMFGGPKETVQTVEEGLNNIELLRHTVVFVFSGIRILPKTGLADIAVNQGIITPGDNLLHPAFYVAPGLDKKKMDLRIEAAFQYRKDRFFPPEKGYIRMKTVKLFGFKGLLWDMIPGTFSQGRRIRKKGRGTSGALHDSL